MKSGFWLSRFWRMPSLTDTVERFSSSTPSATPLTYRTRSGRFVFRPVTVTSSAMAKWLLPGFRQSINQTVTVCSLTLGLTFTP